MSLGAIDTGFEAAGAPQFAPDEALTPILEGMGLEEFRRAQLSVMRKHDSDLLYFHDDRYFALSRQVGEAVADGWANGYSFGYALVRTGVPAEAPLPSSHTRSRLNTLRERLTGKPDALHQLVDEAFGGYPGVMDAVDTFGSFNGGTTAGALFMLAVERRLAKPSMPEFTARPIDTEGGKVFEIPKPRPARPSRQDRLLGMTDPLKRFGLSGRGATN